MGSRADSDGKRLWASYMLRASYMLLTFLFAAANISIVPVAVHANPVTGQIVTLLAVASLGAQLCLVATWGVLGSASFLVRLLRCAALGVTSYACVSLGVGFVALTSTVVEFDEPELFLVLLTALPLVFFCVQLPLWALRLWFGWEVAQVEASSVGSYARPVTIKDLVLGMAVASVAMALVRLGPLLAPSAEDGAQMLMGVSFMAACGAGVSLLTLPPLVFAILGSRRPAAGAMGVAAWTLAFIAVCSTAVTLATGQFPSPPQVTAFTMLALVFVALVASGLLLARASGYRLYWRSLRSAKVSPMIVSEKDQS